MLVAARVLQGVSAAIMAPTALAMLMTTFPDGPERNKALAIWGSTGGLGAAAAADRRHARRRARPAIGSSCSTCRWPPCDRRARRRAGAGRRRGLGHQHRRVPDRRRARHRGAATVAAAHAGTATSGHQAAFNSCAIIAAAGVLASLLLRQPRGAGASELAGAG